MGDGPAEGRVRELLAPFADGLTPGALDAYALPVSDGSQRNRRNMRAAAELLAEAGLDGAGRGAAQRGGRALRVRDPAAAGQSEAVTNIFVDALRQLGIAARVQLVDQAQYNERRNAYDYDMIVNAWNMSLQPGNEQMLYWGRTGSRARHAQLPGRRQPGGGGDDRGRCSRPATRRSSSAAVQALDRVLTTGRYVIPFWFPDMSLIAHKAELKYPGAAAGLWRLDRLAAGGLVAAARVSGGRKLAALRASLRRSIFAEDGSGSAGNAAAQECVEARQAAGAPAERRGAGRSP